MSATIAYRDRRDEFETLVFDFTDDIDEARRATAGSSPPMAAEIAGSRASR